MVKLYVCCVCGFILEPETTFEEIPDDWICPVCGVNKHKFNEYHLAQIQ